MNNLLENIPIKDLQDFLYNRRRKNECVNNQLYAQAADINDIRDLKLKKLLDDR